MIFRKKLCGYSSSDFSGKMELCGRKNHRSTQGRGTEPCPPPLRPCNKVLKPNFQSAIFQTNNGCSLFSPILAKLLLLDISCENIFALSVVTALTACPFSVKKYPKNPLAVGGYAPASSYALASDPLVPLLLAKSWVRQR